MPGRVLQRPRCAVGGRGAKECSYLSPSRGDNDLRRRNYGNSPGGCATRTSEGSSGRQGA